MTAPTPEYQCDYCKKGLESDDLAKSVFWWDEADNHLSCLDCAKQLDLRSGFSGGFREKF